MSKFNFLIAALIVTFASGCLKTREELRNEGSGSAAPVERKTIIQKNKEEAAKPEAKAPPAGFRFEEYDEQLRQLNGRVDNAETKVQRLEAAAQADSKDQAVNQKLQAYEEELKRLNEEVRLLSEQMTQLRSVQAAPQAPAAPVAKAGSDKSTPYDDGEAAFKEKKWREAIVAYEKYRSTYPKGKNFLDATYKIGLCFHELGMKDEARAFYQEVVEKAPKSKEAKKANFRLGLKSPK